MYYKVGLIYLRVLNTSNCLDNYLANYPANTSIYGADDNNIPNSFNVTSYVQFYIITELVYTVLRSGEYSIMREYYRQHWIQEKKMS